MNRLIAASTTPGYPTLVRGEDVPDCGPMETMNELSLRQHGEYAPEIVDGIAFCTPADQGKGPMVAAVELASGTVKWETAVDEWVWRAPASVGETVVVGTDNGSVYCLNQRDGHVLWSCKSLGRKPWPSAVWSLRIRRSIGFFGLDDGDTFSLDVTTGEQRWMRMCSDKYGSIWSNPVVWGDSVLFCIGDDLYCLDVDTGMERWHLTYGVGPGNNHQHPLLVGDLLFIPTLIGRIYAIDLSTQTLSWRIESTSIGSTWTPVALGDMLYYRHEDKGIIYGTLLRPFNKLFPGPVLALQTDCDEPRELSIHNGCLYCPSGQWLYVVEPHPVEGIPAEFRVRKYRAPEPFATGLAHDGDLLCAGTTTGTLLIGRLPDSSPRGGISL